MARILIIYQSKTGNTEQMSEAVETGIKKRRGERCSMEWLLDFIFLRGE